MLGVFEFSQHVFHNTVVIFLLVGTGTLPWVEFWRYLFSLIFVIFLYKKTPKIRKKNIFKIPSTVGLQYPQLNNDNSVVTYMLIKFKHTEQGLYQTCGSFFYLLLKKKFARISWGFSRTYTNMFTIVMLCSLIYSMFGQKYFSTITKKSLHISDEALDRYFCF